MPRHHSPGSGLRAPGRETPGFGLRAAGRPATPHRGERRHAQQPMQARSPKPEVSRVRSRMRARSRDSEEAVRMRKLMLAVAVVFACGLLSGPAQLQQQRGGEDETGPYEVVPNWPQPIAQPGYALGSQGGVFAESPEPGLPRQPRRDQAAREAAQRLHRRLWRRRVGAHADARDAQLHHDHRRRPASWSSRGRSGTSCSRAAAVRTRSRSARTIRNGTSG